MNKRLALLVAAGVILAGGAIAYVGLRDDNQSSPSNTSETTEQDEEVGASGQTFQPRDMADTAFVATVEGEQDGGESYQMTLEHDGQGNSRLAGTQDGTKFETIFTADAFYSCEDDNCVKFPVNQSQGAPFQPDEYLYEDTDIEDYRSNAVYRGQQPCNAGTCDVWEVTEDDTTATLYLDSNQRINQVVSSTETGSVTITYEYRNVSIDIPTNAQTVPTFEP